MSTNAAVPDAGIVQDGLSEALREAWAHAHDRTCVVCGEREGELSHSELHKGQLVPVCRYCVAKYKANPEPYFARLQPRAALFQDDYANRPPVNWFSFVVGVYALAGVACAGIASNIAVKRGHSGWSPALWGLFTTALGVVLATRLPDRSTQFGASGGWKIPSTHTPVPCPACSAENHPAASRCSVCGAPLTPTVTAEVALLDRTP